MNAHTHLVAVFPEPRESVNDHVLLEVWIREQDSEAFATLVRRYAGLVLGVCRRQCRCVQDADDAFQATFLCLMRNASKIRKPDQLAAWLYGTAYRTAVAARRRRRNNETAIVDDPPTENNPLIQVSRRHELRILDEELSKLAEPYRSAIVLHWIEGLETAEVADQLRVSTAVIRGRLQRGRVQLEQRLRRRGVTAFAVLATLAAWPIDHATAASCADAFIASQASLADVANPDTDTFTDNSSLESLLETGTSTMTWTTTLGCTAVLAIAAIASTASWTNDGTAQIVISSSAVAREPEVQPAHIRATDNALGQAAAPAPATAPAPAAPSNPSVTVQPANLPSKPVAPNASERPPTLRADIEKEMLTEATFSMEGVPLSELASQLRKATGLPIVVDQRGAKVASDLRPDPTFTFDADGLPMQVALQELLRPNALRAEVRDYSVVITADTAELARHGIATSAWINVDEDAAKSISDALSNQVTLQFIDEPLDSALRTISEELKIPIKLDRLALEETGLTPDTPVTAEVSGVQARTVLDQILAPLQLTLTYRREYLVVTTPDAAEQNRLQRIYYLDGLGMDLVIPDYDSFMMAIQQSIDADTWEALGGPSTMCPMILSMEHRPSLVISTTLSTHEQIESFLNMLRKTNLGPDVGSMHQMSRMMFAPMGGGGMGGGGMSGGMSGGMGGGMGGGGMF
jgi:RNA polymerase sigma factor (sigma-70 family)